MREHVVAITETDQGILLALARYHYLTAAQAGRLFYPKLVDENRYMQRRFKKLVDAGYVLRLRALPKPRYGMDPHVFVLGQRGRKFVRNLGLAVSSYFRPSEEQRAAYNNPFMYHRLAAIDILIAADCLCRDYAITCPRLLTERALRRAPVKVQLANGQVSQRVAVIPDAWFQLKFADTPPVSVALELDRSTEDQSVWRRKIAAYIAWAQGPYRDTFETDNLTVAVGMPTVSRRDQLREWTVRELTKRNARELADIFLFTAASPVTTRPFDFFFGHLWFLPNEAQPVSLLDLPEALPREVFSLAP